jgi:acetoin utilization protein AcuB
VTLVVSIGGKYQLYELPDHDELSSHQIKTARIKSLGTEHYERFINEKDYQKIAKRLKPGKKPPKKKEVDSYAKASKPIRSKARAIFAEDIMSDHLIYVKEDDTLTAAIEIMFKYQIRHVLVFNEDELLTGILSDRDVVRLHQKNASGRDLIIKHMSQNVIMGNAQTEISDIARVMLQERISCIPIIDSLKVVVGVVSVSDILKTVMKGSGIALEV